MRKGLNMKMAAMGLALASMVACTGKDNNRRYLLRR